MPQITEHLVDVLNIRSASTKEVQELVAKKEGKMLMTQDIKNLRNKYCNYAGGEEAENVDKVVTKYTMQSRDASASIQAMSLKYNTRHNSDTINTIQNDLTPFAAKLVSEQ
ncbi:unnamed protein product, partial [Lymnaea stagnalis]